MFAYNYYLANSVNLKDCGLRIVRAFALAFFLVASQSTAPVYAVSNIYTVDRNDDVAGLACTGAANDCTLRSAIQLAESDGVTSYIFFAGDYTINLTTSLPFLTANSTFISGVSHTILINGGSGVGNIFRITGDDISLDTLRIYGSGSGFSNIYITGSAQRAVIFNNIIGHINNVIGGLCGYSPNSYGGIYIDSSSTIAAGDARAWIYGNTIKCNAGSPGDGIDIVGTNKVILGADALGNASDAQKNILFANSGDGVIVQAGSSGNTVRNSDLVNNFLNGLAIYASSFTIVQNVNAYWNYGNGIGIYNGSAHNTIQFSQISVNEVNGVYILDSPNNALVADTNDILDNGQAGIRVAGNSPLNFLWPRLVQNNGGAGIAVTGNNSTQNSIWVESIKNNGGLPIDLGNNGHTANDIGDGDSGPNTLLNYPVITAASGFNIGGSACNNCYVDIYRAIGDPAKPYGGGEFVTTRIASPSGAWNANLTAYSLGAADITLVARDGTGNASEMSPRPQLFLPLIKK